MSRLTRRQFARQFARLCAASAAAALVPLGGDAAATKRYRLRPQPALVPLLGPGAPGTRVWGCNGRVPGPEIRLRRGQRLRVEVENRLGQETTVHWHGLRIPNAMDGVPYVTQPPIPPGGRFVYDFEPPDAGTFWYHPRRREVTCSGQFTTF